MKTGSKGLFVLIWVSLGVFVLLETPCHVCAAGMNTIRILDRAEIKADKIRLGDIAEISGKNPEGVRRLQNIVIGKAPLPGRSRSIDEEYIIVRLRQNDIDPSQIQLKGSNKVDVLRSFIKIPKEKVETVVLDYIRKVIPWEKDRVKIKKVHVSEDVLLPEGSVSYRVVPPKNMDFLGSIPLSVLFNVNEEFVTRVWATVYIEVLTEAVVTKRPLKRHQLITEDDVTLKKVDLSRVRSNVFSSYEEVVGKRTKTAIGVDVLLKTDHIELPPLVKRGDVVVIIAESEGLRVTALGEVRKRGCRGERIRVMNLDSKKGIYARVVDANTVTVDF
jgi:flagella basal body P-ring formation protein FlgA